MADSKVPTAGTKTNVPEIPNVDKVLPNEKVWEYQRRIRQAQLNKGSRYPPFSIQHMPWVRQRIDSPMTEEDRFLRKQWLKDQQLSPNEPRYVEGAKPMFKLRRISRLPWDYIENLLGKVMSPVKAHVVRTLVPKMMMSYAFLLALFYHVTYHPKSWETHHGFAVYLRKQPKIPGQDHSQLSPDITVQNLRGFDQRTSHFNAKTSGQGQ